MRFIETKLPGAYLIELEKKIDQRGFFARSWCQREFAARGLNTRIVQCNVGYSTHAGTLRGIHYQTEPHAEAKVVRCLHGAVYDVIVDLRPESSTYGCYRGVELTAESRTMIYIPAGFGHGYETLVDDTEIFYQTSEFYHPESCAGIRYDDPALGITWPCEVRVVSETDQSWPDISLEAAAR